MSHSDETGSPGELVATVSHELRQPLASIRGFTEMLLAHWADFSEPEKLQMLEEILHDAKRVGRLVDELLEGSRLEPGPLRLFLRPTDIGEVVGRALRSLALALPELEATVAVADGVPSVMADGDKLEQVLVNLVENACKHGSSQGVSVNVSVESAPGGEEVVVVTVADHGPGIKAEDLPRVTEKFFRSPTSEVPGGLGLGLWICRGIIEAHGGELVVGPGQGDGTQVSLVLPLRSGARTGKLAGS